MVFMLPHSSLPLLRAVEQPNWVCDTFENPPSQQLHFNIPENNVLGRLRSQMGVLVPLLLSAPWRARTASHRG